MLTTLEPFMLTANMLQISIKHKIENDNLSNEKTKLSCSVPTIKKPLQLSAPVILGKSTFIPFQ